jgi:transcriptional regulator with XRE-family HTH domain
MQALIRQIRTYLNMSQTEFADHINVAYITVNRWENGRALPNKLAQSKIYEICKADNVPVYDMTLERIRDIADITAVTDGRVLLFHGSKSGIDGKIEPISRPQCDFGQGFYMGTEASQALTLICDYEKSKLYLTSVDLTGLRAVEVPANIDWAMLVAFHRGKMEKIAGTPLYEKNRAMTLNKDLVIGCIANDRMFYVIDNFFIGNITDTALVNSLAALQLGKQYVAVSEKGCEAVTIEKEIGISWLERLFIKDVAEENRAKGVSMANDICRNYRREGLFFDELLDRAGNGAP